MHKQEQQDGFVSFMVEKDDSFALIPNDSIVKQTLDEDFYKSLSRQFYGERSSSSQCDYNLGKKTPHIDPTIIKQKIMSRALQANTLKPKPGVSAPTVSEQLQQQIQRLLSSSKPKMQSHATSSFKATIQTSQKINKIKNPYIQSLKLNIPIQTKKSTYEPRTQRLRIEDSNGDQFNQNSYRSTLNSSTKSTAKLEKHMDLYYPIKASLEDSQNLFKISFRNKP